MKQVQINKVSLMFTWEDGKTENMYQNLPEYLFDQINEYLNELEQHRAEVQEDYVFCDDLEEFKE